MEHPGCVVLPFRPAEQSSRGRGKARVGRGGPVINFHADAGRRTVLLVMAAASALLSSMIAWVDILVWVSDVLTRAATSG